MCAKGWKVAICKTRFSMADNIERWFAYGFIENIIATLRCKVICKQLMLQLTQMATDTTHVHKGPVTVHLILNEYNPKP